MALKNGISCLETETLERGLLKLSLADASVEVTATAKGERILACLGEIHLERCILDLESVYCDHNIKLRISDPITNFCETTEWFENEHDFDAFLAHRAPPLRQATIPPYCDEEGLSKANRGRCRALLSGRGAAIGIRVVPLPRSVHECLKTKSIIDGSEDDLITIGKALKCHMDESMLTPQMVLDVLTKSLDSIDANGNALFESALLFKGASVRAIHSSNGEVYTRHNKQATTASELDKEDTVAEGVNEYQAVQSCIKNGLTMDITDSADETSDQADKIALEKWKQDMRGSALAGFQLAMRAGPLCEEPVRGVAVILESVEIAVVKKTSGEYVAARDVTGGMVVAALRSGIRCALM
jgi:ribosome assembly protein 1